MTDVKFCDISTVKKLFLVIYDILEGRLTIAPESDQWSEGIKYGFLYMSDAQIVSFHETSSRYYFLRIPVSKNDSEIFLYSNNIDYDDLNGFMEISKDMIYDIIQSDMDDSQIVLSYGRIKIPYEFGFRDHQIKTIDDFISVIRSQNNE